MLHKFAEYLIHHAVARDGRLAREALGHDREPPMRLAAGSGACMPGVLRALIGEVQRHRLEGGQPLAYLGGDVHGLSSAYFARKSDWTTTKASISPMPPNSLKLTQRSVEKL